MVGHILDVFNHSQKLLVDLGVIFMIKFASNMNTGQCILVDSSSKLVDKCEALGYK